MYINKPSVTKIEASDRTNFFLHSTIYSGNHEKLVKCLCACPDMRHFMTVTKKTLAFRHTN